MRGRGLPTESLLSGAGLSLPLGSCVTVEQYGALWLGVAEALDDEFFGFGARPMYPGGFALLCRCVLRERDLEGVLRQALRFLRVVIGEPRGHLVVSGEETRVILRDVRAEPRPAFAYRTFWIILHGLMCWMVGRHVALRDVRFRCPPPADGRDYATFFGVPVRFSQGECDIAFDSKALALPTIRDEADMATFLRGAPANILVRCRRDVGVSALVRGTLQSRPFTAWPTFDDLAADLGMPAATLRRRLKREGWGYQDIKDELRSTKALRLLGMPGASVAEVAELLGFAEPSAFHRAFRRWTSRRPGEVKRSSPLVGT